MKNIFITLATILFMIFIVYSAYMILVLWSEVLGVKLFHFDTIVLYVKIFAVLAPIATCMMWFSQILYGEEEEKLK